MRAFFAAALLCAIAVALSGCGNTADVAAVAPVIAASWPVTIADMASFFCQLRCTDGSLPLVNPSMQTARQQMADAICWTRYANDSDSSVDSVEYGGNAFVLAWKFGENFDLSRGAGGEVYKDWSGTVKIMQTQDGGTPFMQYFVGPDDGSPLSGWIVADNTAPTGRWKAIVAQLGIATTPDAKLSGYSKSYTRWRLEDVTYEAVVFGEARQITIPTIISEHYDGDSIETSSALERSFYAQGFGRAAWEAWRRNGTSTTRKTGTDWSTSPAEGWVFGDGGNNMRFEKQNGSVTVNSYGWP